MLTIGVSYEALRLPTIHPQPHDIAMDFVVTEAGIYRAGGSPITLIDAAPLFVTQISPFGATATERGAVPTVMILILAFVVASNTLTDF